MGSIRCFIMIIFFVGAMPWMSIHQMLSNIRLTPISCAIDIVYRVVMNICVTIQGKWGITMSFIRILGNKSTDARIVVAGHEVIHPRTLIISVSCITVRIRRSHSPCLRGNIAKGIILILGNGISITIG